MNGPLFGLDVGTSAVKGLAIDADGGVLRCAQAGYPLSTPRPGWAEQDPADWWEATESVLAQLRNAAGAPAGIGLSGQMHGLVALDARDRVLRPAILWNDQRTAAECRADRATPLGLERLIALTGNRALPGFTAPKLLWLRRHEPDVYAQIARVLLPKDYVRLRLCGEHATDVSDASGTLLLDVARRRWSEDVLERARARPPRGCRRCSRARTVSGDDRRTASRSRRAAATRPRARSASASTRPGPVSVVLGTSGVVFAALDGVRRRSAGARARLLPRGARRLARDGRDALGGGLAALAARCHDSGRLLTTSCSRTPRGWPAGYGGAARSCPTSPASAPRTPTPTRAARSSGSASATIAAALVRAVLEGVAFGLRDSLDLIAELGGRPALGRVSGGGARSELWLRIVASVLELPLERGRRRRGRGVRRRDPRRRRGRRLARRRTRRSPPPCARATRIEPRPEWVEPYRERASATARSTRRCGSCRRSVEADQQSRPGPGSHLERARRDEPHTGRQQSEHVAAEATTDDPRADRAASRRRSTARLDGRRGDLVVVAQARVRGVEQAPERRRSRRLERRDGLAATRSFSVDDVARAPRQRLGQAARPSRASRHAGCRLPARSTGPRALAPALVVARAGVRVALARVERDEPVVAQLERDRAHLQRAEVDPQRLAALAEQRGDLVQQAGLRPDPVVLDSRAELGQLEAAGPRRLRRARSAPAPARPRAPPRTTVPSRAAPCR